MRGADISRRVWRGLRILGVAALALGAVGLAIMSLWNWLAPAMFGGHAIGFWQALGVFVLARLLLGGWRGRGGHGRFFWRRQMSERWSRMSEEERERFRRGFAHRCGTPPEGGGNQPA
jgi:hypothetical protein